MEEEKSNNSTLQCIDISYMLNYADCIDKTRLRLIRRGGWEVGVGSHFEFTSASSHFDLRAVSHRF